MGTSDFVRTLSPLRLFQVSRQAIEVKLPKASQATAVKRKPLAVTLSREGRLYLDGAPVEPSALRDAVRRAVAKDKDAQVIIAGDKDVAHGRVVWVLDLVKGLGVTSFAIQIDPSGLMPPSAAR